MSTKALITIGILFFSLIFSWIGTLIGGGWFGLWSNVLGVLGCFVGIWAGYEFGKWLGN